MSDPLWLYIDFPELSLEAVRTAESENQPQAVINTDQQPQQIFCVNQAAVEWGLEPGLTLSTALALCPELIALARQPQWEHSLLERLALLAYQFTPAVLMMPPTGLALELSCCERLMGSFDGLLLALRQHLHQHIGLMHNGIAPSASGARLLCQTRWQSSVSSADTQRQQLMQAPLHSCPFSKKIHKQLWQMGLKQLGELLTLPEHTLIRRFGREFVKQLRELSGDDKAPLRSYQPPDTFSDELQSLDGIRSKEGLLFPMKTLLQGFSSYLQARQVNCRSLRWRFEPLMGKPVSMSLQITGSQHHWKALLELSRLQLESQAVPEMIEIIGLHSDDFVEMPAANFDLFSKQEFADDSELPDKLRARLGQDAIRQPALIAATLPEQAFTLDTLGERPANPIPPFLNDATSERPSWLLAVPDPIRESNGQLQWYFKALTLLQGPERLRGGWWQQTTHEQQRDYYQAADEFGSRYWIFHDSRLRRWFLHGIFA